MFVQLNDEDRIVGTSNMNCFPEDTKVTEFTFPDGFDFNKQNDYRILDGSLIKSERKKLASITDIIDEQDDAICYLYESLPKEKQTVNYGVINSYVRRINREIITINEVPPFIRSNVKEALDME